MAEEEATPAKPEAPFRVEADGTRVVKLRKSITGHRGIVSEIRLRPPRYIEFMTLGDPSATIIMAGAVLPSEDLGIVRQYIEKLSDIDPLTIEQIDYRDAIALRDAVLDFFRLASVSSWTHSPTP